jgi:hypothetical protein
MGNRDRFMSTWTPRIGSHAAAQQYIAQWLMAIGGFAVVGWIAIAVVGDDEQSGILKTASLCLEIVSLCLVAIGLIVFLVSRRNRISG